MPSASHCAREIPHHASRTSTKTPRNRVPRKFPWEDEQLFPEASSSSRASLHLKRRTQFDGRSRGAWFALYRRIGQSHLRKQRRYAHRFLGPVHEFWHGDFIVHGEWRARFRGIRRANVSYLAAKSVGNGKKLRQVLPLFFRAFDEMPHAAEVRCRRARRSEPWRSICRRRRESASTFTCCEAANGRSGGTVSQRESEAFSLSSGSNRNAGLERKFEAITRKGATSTVGSSQNPGPSLPGPQQNVREHGRAGKHGLRLFGAARQRHDGRNLCGAEQRGEQNHLVFRGRVAGGKNFRRRVRLKSSGVQRQVQRRNFLRHEIVDGFNFFFGRLRCFGQIAGFSNYVRRDNFFGCKFLRQPG